MTVKIYVDRLQESSHQLGEQFDRAFSLISLEERARSARAVFIKPNLTYPVYKKGVTTRVEFVRELVAALLRAKSDLKIFIGEGEGGYNSFSMADAMHAMGFTRLAREYSQVEIVNLSKLSSTRIILNTRKGPYPVELPMAFFEQIDFSISCPLPKVHAMTRVTLSMKNLWGCLPDVMRLKNHYMLPHIVSHVVRLLKFEYAFLDGKYGLTRNGPMEGDPLEVNWFVAANSLGAFDATVTEMMGFRWQSVQHLRIAQEYGLVPNGSDIQILGDPVSLRRQFHLKRSIWNYPALTAFHSKYLTHFFYLSRYAGFLHDVMYTFRKRPIPLNMVTKEKQ